MNKIKEILKRDNIKVSKIIKATGLSKSYVYGVVNGEIIPTVYKAKKIALVLKVSVDELFYW